MWYGRRDGSGSGNTSYFGNSGQCGGDGVCGSLGGTLRSVSQSNTSISIYLVFLVGGGASKSPSGPEK